MKPVAIIVSAFLFLVVMTILTGLLYPLVMTAFAQIAFPEKANGSLIKIGSGIKGSYLLSQEFTSDAFFHPRPSAASFATVPSGASNQGVASGALLKQTETRRAEWQKNYGNVLIPEDMLYASASGLDPDISPESALAQMDRVASARRLGGSQKEALAEEIRTRSERASVFSAIPRINVMELNALLETDTRFMVQ